MGYRFAIFDLDGTLLDTLADLHDSMNHVLAMHGFPARSLAEVRRFVGNGQRRFAERAVPEKFAGDAELIDKIYYEMADWYKDHCKIKTRPYPGIMDALERLRADGVGLAIVSNKVDIAVKELAADYFGGIIKVAVGERPEIKHKPDPGMVFTAMRELGANPSDTVYVGDSEVDVLTARNAGLPCISVTWGFRDEDELVANGATNLAHDAGEMEGLILRSP